MRRLLLTTCLAAVLVPAAAASAKEVKSVSVCGPGTCTKLKGSDDRLHMFVEGGNPVAPPAQPGDTYELRAVVLGGEEVIRFTTLYMPSAGLVRSEDGTWFPLREEAVRAVARQTRTLEAFPPPYVADQLSADVEAVKPAVPVVDEVYVPAAAERSATPTGGGFPWLWVALGAGLLSAALWRLRPRRDRAPQAGTAAAAP